MKYFTFAILSQLFILHFGSGLDDSKKFVTEINSMQSDWLAEENQFTNLPTDNLKMFMGYKKKPDKKINSCSSYEIEVPEAIPAEFDSRTQWPQCESISSIKDQSNCGSCWAVSSSSAMSDRLCIGSNFQVRVNLSAEALMTCCTTCTDGDPGCDGGYLDDAWDYWKWHGLVTGGDYGSNEGCQPYAIKPCKACKKEAKTPPCIKTACTNKIYKKSYKSDNHKGKSSYSVPNNVTLIQADILKNGPLTTGFVVYRDFMSYKEGVYRHVKGEQVGNHAVRILGWGVATSLDNKREIPYWLVANSWNRSWGDNGLFKIIRGTDECDFEENVYAGVPK